MEKIKILLLLFVFAFLQNFGQEFNFQHFTIYEGLASNTVYSIAQDRNKLLWYGTRAGVSRFDGQEFKNYDLITKQRKNYISATAFSILVDEKNRIWAGTSNGLFLYSPEKEKFIFIEKIRKGKDLKTIYKLAVDKKNRLWIGDEGFLYLFDYEKNKLDSVNTFGKSIHSFFIEKDNSVLIGSNSGIYKVSPSQIELKLLSKNSKNNEIFDNTHTFSIFKDNHQKIWFCTLKKGILIYDIQADKFLENTPFQIEIPKSIAINKVIKYGKGYLIGVDSQGLFLVDENYKIIKKYQHNENEPNSLNSNGIYDIYIDENKRVWVAIFGVGINMHDPNLLPFQSISHALNQENSLSNNNGRSVLEDNEGKLWFGTNKGISIFNPETNFKNQIARQTFY